MTSKSSKRHRPWLFGGMVLVAALLAAGTWYQATRRPTPTCGSSGVLKRVRAIVRDERPDAAAVGISGHVIELIHRPNPGLRFCRVNVRISSDGSNFEPQELVEYSVERNGKALLPRYRVEGHIVQGQTVE